MQRRRDGSLRASHYGEEPASILEVEKIWQRHRFVSIFSIGKVLNGMFLF